MKNKYYYYTLVGRKIRQMREYCGLKLDDVVEHGNLPKEMEDYENGAKIPIMVIEGLSRFYGVSVREFLPTMKECNIFWAFKNGTGIHGEYRYSIGTDGKIIKQNVNPFTEYMNKRGNGRNHK